VVSNLEDVGTATTVKENKAILHSQADDVAPFEDSVELVATNELPSNALIEVGTEHGLADRDSLNTML
jgi:hypothetical protein